VSAVSVRIAIFRWKNISSVVLVCCRWKNIS